MPSNIEAIAVPLSPSSCIGMSISEGLLTSRSPLPVISNTASSEVDPNRFFILLSIRYDPRVSPSNWSTTSTMCSNSFGPAI